MPRLFKRRQRTGPKRGPYVVHTAEHSHVTYLKAVELQNACFNVLGGRGRRLKSCRPDGLKGLKVQVRALPHFGETGPFDRVRGRCLMISHIRS